MHTLEIEWFLRERCKGGACEDRVTEAVGELESFLKAYEYGFRLLIVRNTDEESVKEQLETLAGLQDGFRFFFGQLPKRLLPVSRNELLGASRREKFQRFAIMRHGSFAERAITHPRLIEMRKRMGKIPVPYGGMRLNLTLDRTIRTCFNTSGLTSLLKEHLKAAFAKLVENELVAIWLSRLCLAAFGNPEEIEPVQALARSLKRTAPFGAVATPEWELFYLVE